MKKFLGFLLLTATLLFAFSSRVFAIGYANTAADIEIGHPSFTCAAGERDGDNVRGMYHPIGSVLVVGSKLIVPGGNIARIRIFNTIPTSNNPYPDVTLGVDDPCLHLYDTTPPSEYLYPDNMFFAGNHFFVVDNGFNRILVYDGIPTSNSNPPVLVLGQPDLTTKTANTGGLSASSLSAPYDVWSDGTRVIVSDQGNNRILIWNTFPTTNGQAADVVIGQTDMVTGTSGITATKFNGPRGLDVDNGKLYVADYNNNRVLIYNSIPVANNATADLVIGQPNMTSNTANNGGINANTLNLPMDVSIKNGKMFIGDRNNNRILIFNTLPTGNRPNADVVVGQTDFVTGTAGVSASKFNYPYSGFSDGTKLYVVDYNNNRIVIFNTIPASNGAAADIVIGQEDMTSNIRMLQKPLSASNMYAPWYIAAINNSLYVSSSQDKRVLKYNSIPTTNGVAADVVIGQPDMSSSGTAITATGFPDSPAGVSSDGTKLIIVNFSRVLIYNSFPTANGAAADVVIGQPDMTHNVANNGGISAKSLYIPYAARTDGTKLFIADGYNNRILIFNSIPTSNFASADVVIGQPDFTHNTANNGGVSATSLNVPTDLCLSNGKLVVVDSRNNRVLVYNSIPTTNGAAADVVIGQPDMSSSTANNGGLSANSLNGVWQLYCDGGRLFISDVSNSRILAYNTIPSSNHASADAVIGQPNMTTAIPGARPQGLSRPGGMAVAGGKLFVTDQRTSRVSGFPLAPRNVVVTGGGTFNSSAVSLALAADDAKEVMISEDPLFTGASWSSFATSKAYTVSAGDGVKTLYVKMRDYANYESSTFTTTVTVDTTKPAVVKLTDIGKITNVPDKSPLYYYFTSQFAQIRGTADAGSTVHFKYGSKDFTAIAGSDGEFLVTVTGLPRELVEFSYYAQDVAGNKSTSRILKLLVGEENFPTYLVESTATPSVTPTPTATTVPTSSPTQTPTPTLVLYDVQLTDQAGHVLKNTIVYINGQKYQTDGNGKLYVQESVAKSAGVTVEVNGKKYQGNILGNTIVAQLSQPTKKTSYAWVWTLVIVIPVVWYIALKRRKSS